MRGTVGVGSFAVRFLKGFLFIFLFFYFLRFFVSVFRVWVRIDVVGCYCLFFLLHVVPAINQFHNHAQSLKVASSGGPLDNQT